MEGTGLDAVVNRSVQAVETIERALGSAGRFTIGDLVPVMPVGTGRKRGGGVGPAVDSLAPPWNDRVVGNPSNSLESGPFVCGPHRCPFGAARINTVPRQSPNDGFADRSVTCPPVSMTANRHAATSRIPA